jgi:hypothetical protein
MIVSSQVLRDRVFFFYPYSVPLSHLFMRPQALYASIPRAQHGDPNPHVPLHAAN